MLSASNVSHPRLVGVSLIGAPLLMLSADAASLAFGGAGVPGGIALWVAFYGFVGASIGMMQLAGSGWLAVVGALFAVFGCLLGTTIVGTDRVFNAMLQRGMTSEFVTEIAMEPAIFLTSRAPGLAFPIGLFILTIALARAQVLSRVAASVLAVGVVLFPVGRIAVGVAANVVSDALMLAVLGGLGLKVLRGKGGRREANVRAAQAV